jgi:hypothetical protein
LSGHVAAVIALRILVEDHLSYLTSPSSPSALFRAVLRSECVQARERNQDRVANRSNVWESNVYGYQVVFYLANINIGAIM